MTTSKHDTATTATGVLSRYTVGGLAGNMRPGARPALLVIDMQKGFTDPSCGPGFNMPEVLTATARLVAAAHDNDVPVIFTRIAFHEGEDPLWLTKMPAMSELREGTGWVEVDPVAGISGADSVVVKQTASAFSGTGLEQQLHAAGVDTLVVCGATTSGCVRATVVDAMSLGLRPFVVAGAVGDREPAPHQAALLDIQAKYGEVVPLETALPMLQEPR